MYLKFLALIFTFLSLLLCSKLPIISPQWFSLFSAMLMTHFALSFYYSKDYIDLFFHKKKISASHKYSFRKYSFIYLSAYFALFLLWSTFYAFRGLFHSRLKRQKGLRPHTYNEHAILP